MAILPRRTRSQAPAIEQRHLDLWQARRAQLETSLSAAPQGDWAWLWRTRIKVIDYLLERYAPGGQGCADAPGHDATQLGPAARRVTTTDEPTAPYDRVPPPAGAHAPMDSQAARERKARLESLHQTNERRREREPITPVVIPKTFAPIYPKHNEDAGATLARLLESIARPIQNMTCPDDWPGPPGEPDREAFIDALTDTKSEQTGMGVMRQIIAFDLGMPEMPVEMLDEQTIRAILAEHGIESDNLR